MSKRVIRTGAAPAAIGTYSQGVQVGRTVYLSGQIGLVPETMKLAEGVEGQIRQVFTNLRAVAEAAGSSLADAVRVTIYLTDLDHFAKVNEIMAAFFTEPYPTRSTVGVAALPRGAAVEIDAVLMLASAGESDEPPIGAFRFQDQQV
jgi:reactive intermediate/imine deaminase